MSDTVAIGVSGMSCASCVGSIERALLAVDGVSEATASLADRKVRITGSSQIDMKDVVQTIEGAGYSSVTRNIIAEVDGLHCASCVARAEAALLAVPGVLSAQVSLPTQSARVRLVDGLVSDEDLAAALTQAGFEWRPQAGQYDQTDEDRHEAEASALLKRALVSGILTLPIVVLEMGGHLFPAFHHLINRTIGQDTSWIIQFVLATLVLVGPGRDFFRLGGASLIRRAPDMNALVALGAGAAWAFSAVVILAPGSLPENARAVYFEASAVIVTLILVGRTLEARARGQAGQAIRRLVSLAPDTGLVERDGKLIEVAVSTIGLGDFVHLRPGGRVPVDGDVIAGESFVDESMLTGEPVPVAKGPGDTIVAGTINGTGSIRFQATAVGSDTMLAGIVALVERAQATRLPVEDMVNRITSVFVPAVLAIAIITVALWLIFGPDPALSHALVAGVSVLIIACPCAMGLATPMSIMVGMGRAAQLGVLFRKGEALQRLEDVRVVAFDKTGTLTEGQPEVVTCVAVTGLDQSEVLLLAAAVEAFSEHPVAEAIRRAAMLRDLAAPTAEGFSARPGLGAEARVNDATIRVGSARYLESIGIGSGQLSGLAEVAETAGETPIFVARDDQLIGGLAIADPVRADAKRTVSELQAQGLGVAMVSGDREGTARAIARSLGIDDVVAEVLPDEKVAAITALRGRYGSVAFVGDGINDAPALAAADVGIAIGSGTDVAIESADVVLASGQTGGVVRAIAVSRATLRNLRQNLFWAFAYNVALIPIAAGILYPFGGPLLSPVLAAGAMSLSSVFVVTNALRLRIAAAPTGDAGSAAAPLQAVQAE